MPLPTEDSIKAVVGHEFPGGEYIIRHWENFLLTECTGAEALPDGLAHPVALFHVPILGANTSIGEMFELGQANSEHAINIESYEWTLTQPLREEKIYQISGRVVSVERQVSDLGNVFDRIEFEFNIEQAEEEIASSKIVWHYARNQYEKN